MELIAAYFKQKDLLMGKYMHLKKLSYTTSQTKKKRMR